MNLPSTGGWVWRVVGGLWFLLFALQSTFGVTDNVLKVIAFVAGLALLIGA